MEKLAITVMNRKGGTGKTTIAAINAAKEKITVSLQYIVFSIVRIIKIK